MPTLVARRSFRSSSGGSPPGPTTTTASGESTSCASEAVVPAMRSTAAAGHPDHGGASGSGPVTSSSASPRRSTRIRNSHSSSRGDCAGADVEEEESASVEFNASFARGVPRGVPVAPHPSISASSAAPASAVGNSASSAIDLVDSDSDDDDDEIQIIGTSHDDFSARIGRANARLDRVRAMVAAMNSSNSSDVTEPATTSMASASSSESSSTSNLMTSSYTSSSSSSSSSPTIAARGGLKTTGLEEEESSSPRRSSRKRPPEDSTHDQKPDAVQDCSICLSVPSRSEETKLDGCEHTFCFSCIETWAKRENSCPLCKVRFKMIERVCKSPAPKRRGKRGGGKREAPATKRIENRDQSADLETPTIQGLLASLFGANPPMIDMSGTLFQGMALSGGSIRIVANGRRGSSSDRRRSGSASVTRRSTSTRRRSTAAAASSSSTSSTSAASNPATVPAARSSSSARERSSSSSTRLHHRGRALPTRDSPARRARAERIGLASSSRRGRVDIVWTNGAEDSTGRQDNATSAAAATMHSTTSSGRPARGRTRQGTGETAAGSSTGTAIEILDSDSDDDGVISLE